MNELDNKRTDRHRGTSPDLHKIDAILNFDNGVAAKKVFVVLKTVSDWHFRLFFVFKHLLFLGVIFPRSWSSHYFVVVLRRIVEHVLLVNLFKTHVFDSVKKIEN